MSKKRDPLAELKRLERELKELSRKMHEEERIIAAELHERLRLGLQGDDAVNHFNDWMMLHNLTHLVIED